MIFKQVFRIAFITFIWKQYKAWIVSSFLLLISFFIIGQIHADLLHVWELNSDTTYTSISLLYKWLAYAGCIILYCLFHYFRRKKSPSKTAETDKETRKKLQKELANLPSDEDPFNEIRRRDKLRSKSDFLLSAKQNQENN